MTDTDRQRLAAILGMLGSSHAGERAAAALQAEAFRKKHGLAWTEVINGKTVYVGGNPPWHTPEDAPALWRWRQAAARIAELEAELQRMRRPEPPPPPSPPKPEPFVGAPWTPPELTPSPHAPAEWDLWRVFTTTWVVFVVAGLGWLIQHFGHG